MTKDELIKAVEGVSTKEDMTILIFKRSQTIALDLINEEEIAAENIAIILACRIITRVLEPSIPPICKEFYDNLDSLVTTITTTFLGGHNGHE